MTFTLFGLSQVVRIRTYLIDEIVGAEKGEILRDTIKNLSVEDCCAAVDQTDREKSGIKKIKKIMDPNSVNSDDEDDVMRVVSDQIWDEDGRGVASESLTLPNGLN